MASMTSAGSGLLVRIGKVCDVSRKNWRRRCSFWLQGNHHGCFLVAREAGCTIGDAGEDAKEGDLVGGRLFVDQYQMAQQGQGAKAVIGQSQYDACPCITAEQEAIVVWNCGRAAKSNVIITSGLASFTALSLGKYQKYTSTMRSLYTGAFPIVQHG